MTPADQETEKGSSKKFKPKPITDARSPVRYGQFLGFVLVFGFLVIGSSAGIYLTLEDAMVAPCLGCLGLYPNVELKFTFDTVDDQPHPDFVLEALLDGPVFIEFTQDDENCRPCARMRPDVEALEEEYNEHVVFFIINVNHNKMDKMFDNEKKTTIISDSEEDDYYGVYDLESIAGGLVATPTFIIVTIEEDDSGEVRPKFAVGYGEFVEESHSKTKKGLADAIDYALAMHHHYLEMYISEE